MSKHARIRRLRAEREAAKEEGNETTPRGPISAMDAGRRARVRKAAGVGAGVWANGTRVRRQIKRVSNFRLKAEKKTRIKKRGRR